jgi:two-component system response regulator YesN
VIKVFLVDDEIEIREGIRERVNWQEEGFEYCGDAPDGEIALPLIEKMQPDILITDIKMPFLNGLDLSKIVKEKFPNTKIVILSGHDEFEYAREALRLSVDEYCLKPLSSKDLLEVLHRVAAKLNEQQLQQSSKMGKDNFLNELCLGTLTSIEAIEKAAEYQMELISSYYAIMVVNFNTDLQTSGKGIRVLIKSIEVMINRLIESKKQTTYHLFQKSLKEAVILIKGEDTNVISELCSLIRDQCYIKEDFRSFIQSIGIGSTKERIQGIALSYVEADADNSDQSVLRVLIPVSSSGSNESALTAAQFDRSKLIEFFKYGSSSQIAEFTKQYTECIFQSSSHSQLFSYYFMMDVAVTSIHFVSQLGGECQPILESLYKKEILIKDNRTAESIIQFTKEIIEIVISFRSSSQAKYHDTLHKAKLYIQRHYADSEISLHSVASYVNVSPSYFSKVFSQETGQTFIEYLTEWRILQAKELLKMTQHRTYEIAYMVGYNDAHYFCNVFKKATGQTTKDFRNELS